MVDVKKNDKFDLGVKGFNLSLKLTKVLGITCDCARRLLVLLRSCTTLQKSHIIRIYLPIFNPINQPASKDANVKRLLIIAVFKSQGYVIKQKLSYL